MALLRILGSQSSQICFIFRSFFGEGGWSGSLGVHNNWLPMLKLFRLISSSLAFDETLNCQPTNQPYIVSFVCFFRPASVNMVTILVQKPIPYIHTILNSYQMHSFWSQGLILFCRRPNQTIGPLTEMVVVNLILLVPTKTHYQTMINCIHSWRYKY